MEMFGFYDVMKFDFRLLCHGWGSDLDSFFLVESTKAFLHNSDFNVIRFGWISLKV